MSLLSSLNLVQSNAAEMRTRGCGPACKRDPVSGVIGV
jgi:hypothetical protein